MSTRTYTPALPIWCAGCGHFAVQQAIELALVRLGLARDRVLVLAGIGCSGTIQNNLGTYGYHALHGRVLPTAIGAALSDPDLTVIAAGGDGDGYAIGAGHLVHAFRRNVPLTYVLMNNQTYGLTKGQHSPTWSSHNGAYGGLSPLDGVMLGLGVEGSTFLARGYSGAFVQLCELVTAAIEHAGDRQGLAFLEVVSPCVTYEDTYPEWTRRLYDVAENADHDPSDRTAAFALTERLRSEGLVPTGVLFRRRGEGAPANVVPARAAIIGGDLTDRYQALLEGYAIGNGAPRGST